MNRVLLAAFLLPAWGCASAPRALPTAEPANNGLNEARLAAIAPALQAYVDSGKVGGIYAVIARNGHISYERTFGWADIEERDKLKRNDVFRIFSMTKPVVAAAAMKLVDQGRLSVNDPVSKYIPSFTNIRVFAGGTAAAPLTRAPDSAMTVWHLLTHTNGLPYGLTRSPVDTLFLNATMYNPATTLEAFADSVSKLPLHFSPGARWQYSSSLEILGRVIEVASGRTLDRFLDEEIFRPLGMTHTAFRWNDELTKHATTLYEPTDNGLEVVTGGLLRMYEPEASFLWASGGLLSTPDDYLRFAQMLLNRGEFNGVRVLSGASVHEMTRNQLPPQLMPQGRSMLDPGYGFGYAGSVLIDSTRSNMPGSNGIYRWSGYVGTYFWIDPANQLLAMVWTQLSPGGRYPLEDHFQKLVYDALVR